MNRKKILNVNYNINLETLCLFLFLCYPLIKHIFAYVFHILNLDTQMEVFPILLVYIPVFVLIKRSRRIPMDFIAILFFVIMFYLITRLIHPEYGFWYDRKYYGAWEYVIKPINGIYIYLFIRLITNVENAEKALKISSYIMLIYYLYVLLDAMKRGYWVNFDYKGNIIHLDYDLTFGYNVLFFFLISCSQFLKNKKNIDFIYSFLGLTMIILGGSRGPLLGIFVYFLLNIITKIIKDKNSKNYINILKIFIFGLIGLLFLYLSWDNILNFLIKMNPASRTLNMIINGNIADDNGRNLIWKAAIDMIRENPFGYGMMGSRPVLYYLNDVGHPHQLFLEILIDFGVFFGGFFIFAFLYNIYKEFNRVNNEWHDILIIFIARASHLLISGTFWHVFAFWGILAVLKNAKKS